MISLPQPAIDYFNSESKQVLKWVMRIAHPKKSEQKNDGSIKHKIPILNLDNIGDIGWVGKYGKYAIAKKEYVVGFPTIQSYGQFERFVEKLAKRKELNSTFSTTVIWETCFEWFIQQTEETNQIEFATYLLKQLNEHCKDYQFFFPILYLEVQHPFNVGKVYVDFFTEHTIEYFGNQQLFPLEDTESYKKQYAGQVTASVAVSMMDHTKAEDVALQACKLAVDVLKMFSPTVQSPDVPCYFGLESSVNFNPGSNPMCIELDKKKEDNTYTPRKLQILMRNHGRPFELNAQYFERMLKSGFPIVSNFIAEPYQNELSELIHQSIMFYAEAISNQNLHKRIVDLFTIIESFLVRNDNEPILSSITKYFPKVVSKESDARNMVKNMITEMYSVRSAMIHHGRQNQFDLNQLKLLQESIRIFIINMINMGRKHSSKNSFLSEIDDAINAAY